MAEGGQANIIRKVEIIEGGGHHGGGWKVAYADFMTAMMAFFLLLWILSSSDEQKLRGIAEYFTNATLPGGSGVLDGATLGPPGTLTASNGTVVARGSELGKVDDPSPAQWEIKDTTPTVDPEEKVLGTNKGEHENPAAGDATDFYDAEKQNIAEAHDEQSHSNDPSEESKNFEMLRAEIVQAMQASPDLRPLQENVIFEESAEGLRIQIIDQKGKPMFNIGSAVLPATTVNLFEAVGIALTKLPNRMVISGHTDSLPFTGGKLYDNWDLSSDRANATRRVLESTGVDSKRIIRVSGLADTEHLIPKLPDAAANRRISILLQYEHSARKTDGSESQGPMKSHNSASVADPSQPKKEKLINPSTSQKKLKTTFPRIDKITFESLRSALR